MHILKEVLKRKYRYITYCCVKDSQNGDIYAIYQYPLLLFICIICLLKCYICCFSVATLFMI